MADSSGHRVQMHMVTKKGNVWEPTGFMGKNNMANWGPHALLRRQ